MSATTQKSKNHIESSFEEIELYFKENTIPWNIAGNNIPFLLIDPVSETAFTNQQVNGFSKTNNLYSIKTGKTNSVSGITIIEEKKFKVISINNTENILYNAIKLQAKENLIKNGIAKKNPPVCTHLMKEKAGIWIRVEAAALKAALIATDKKEQLNHTKMALAASRMRQLIIRDYFKRENIVELSWGLPLLAADFYVRQNNQKLKEELVQNLEKIISKNSYIVAFPEVFTRTYGLILKNHTTTNLSEISSSTILKEFYYEKLELNFNEDFFEIMKQLNSTYNKKELEEIEKSRQKKVNENQKAYKYLFKDTPFVMIKISNNPLLSYDPFSVYYYKSKGLVYQSINISDNWGAITADKANILISENGNYLYLSQLEEEKNNKIKGNGWELTLNEGYTAEKNDAGNLIIRKTVQQ